MCMSLALHPSSLSLLRAGSQKESVPVPSLVHSPVLSWGTRMDLHHYSSTHRSYRAMDRSVSHYLYSCKGWLLAEEMGQQPEQGLLSCEQLQLLLFLTQKALEKRYIRSKVSVGSQVCQHPLVTLRNDAVEEKQGLSGCFFPAPPVHTHTDIRTPGSSKPQLDRTFAAGSKHRLLALQSKLPSKESCRVQQPKNQPLGMVAALGKPW